MTDNIIFQSVKQNNLKNINFKIERGKFTVVTGPSGSGKSSLAFDTVYSEGQRRFWESLPAFSRTVSEKRQKPSFERAFNIPPSVALEQRNRIRSSRGTVSTQTEIYDLLIQMFSVDSEVICDCGDKIRNVTIADIIAYCQKNYNGHNLQVLFLSDPLIKTGEYLKCSYVRAYKDNKVLRIEDNPDIKGAFIIVDRFTYNSGYNSRLRESLENALREGKGTAYIRAADNMHKISIGHGCVTCGRTCIPPSPEIFSFNSAAGACPSCRGFGNLIEYDMGLIIPDAQKSIRGGAVDPFEKPSYLRWKKRLIKFCEKEKIDVDRKISILEPKEIKKIKDRIYGIFKEIERKSYKIQVRVFTSRYKNAFQCKTCGGSRLRKEALMHKIKGKSIYDVVGLTIAEARSFFEGLNERELKSADSNERIKTILGYLMELGLSYLTLDRELKTLSGGELQRVRLGGYLSSGLTDTLYVLDEPTCGLHARDTEKLMNMLNELCKKGNTVLVVEQDMNVIKSCDSVLELGPGSGIMGGKIMFTGSSEHYIKKIEMRQREDTGYSNYSDTVRNDSFSEAETHHIVFTGINIRNIKDMNLRVPLRKFVCLTGVSGSGKTTLVEEIIYPALSRIFYGENLKVGRFEKISGFRALKGVVLIDQGVPARRSRSAVATYLNFFDEIRKTFSLSENAKKQNLKPGHFSFNVEGGRCKKCRGEGVITVDMSFMGKIEVVCDSCSGKRFTERVLGIRFRGKNIFDVLEMTVDSAITFFNDSPRIIKKLIQVQDMGLGYLPLGMTLDKLSGGELQRVKILRELQEKRAPTLYIFDEPGLGLGVFEIQILINLFRKLIDRGHSVLCIEHDLNIIVRSDYIIDLGPEGGENGGKIVFEGKAPDILENNKSYTGHYLKRCVKKKHNISNWV